MTDHFIVENVPNIQVANILRKAGGGYGKFSDTVEFPMSMRFMQGQYRGWSARYPMYNVYIRLTVRQALRRLRR